MELSGWAGSLYRLCEWVMRLAYVNLLWVVFTLAGLIVFGAMPATLAMFAVARRWVMGDGDVPVFPLFWKVYQAEFKRANGLGLLFGAFGFFLYVDLIYFETFFSHGLVFQVGYCFFLALSILFFLTLMFALPYFAHFQDGMLRSLYSSFLLAMSHPVCVLRMLAGTLAIYYIVWYLPGLQLFFSASALSVWLMWNAMKVFDTVAMKE
ncbi:YesL family protein [Ammoniphilus sp. YIM 78166]|uniref:YesL family protein n=1 Tax=Ammoniphilus sp. YIM 78166 TaxID=1644106 RepID=UPI00106F8611|nr:YesL family protein [Ammoniphilus sp. YIM 78166]